MECARIARTRPNGRDLAHIAEEIQDLGKSEYEAVIFSLTQRIVEHLLLIEHSPATDQRLHWSDEIDDFRDRIDRKLSPSIRRQVEARARRCFRARISAGASQDGAVWRDGCCREPARACPYTLEQVLGEWLPGV